MTTPRSRALLVILDGYGIAEDPSVSAVDLADTSVIDSLIREWPHSRLQASGSAVGLPDGQFGNSEVGHLNIGAGRIVWQDLSRINRAIEDGSFRQNEVLVDAFRKASEKGRLHLIGLFSEGGVHSHNRHLYELLRMAKEYGIEDVPVHAITDGRDTSPDSGMGYCRKFLEKSGRIGTGRIATVIGRYYAMDRDNRWDRTEKAYRLFVKGEGKEVESPLQAFKESYKEGVTDEFILPHRIAGGGESRIRPGDVVLFYNIRGDRSRQIIRAFLGLEGVPFPVDPLDLHLVTFTSYDAEFDPHLRVAWPPVELVNTLGAWASARGIRQLRIAETEKYPHVTYFFNGGIETPYEGENRILIPSPKVATYDLQPEMSAPEMTERLCEEIRKESFDLGVVNYANPDMVGHTGDMDAAIRAVETVDEGVGHVVEAAREHGYKILIIADHGNADRMRHPDGSMHTAHTTAPVPVILIGEGQVPLKEGILADVAPTLLKMMGLPQPDEMTGTPLF